MTTYSLTKQGREWKGKGTNATAVIQAPKALSVKATGAAIRRLRRREEVPGQHHVTSGEG